MRTLLWFRGKDLRLADHPALRAAAVSDEWIPLFVLDSEEFTVERARSASHASIFKLESLRELAAALTARGSRLVVVNGESVDRVASLARRWKVDRVVAQERCDPAGRERARALERHLDVPLELHSGETLHPPGALRTGAGSPYSVFTAFAKKLSFELEVDRPLAIPRRLPPLPSNLEVSAVPIPDDEDLGLTRSPTALPGGEGAARRRLGRFVRDRLASYAGRRDRMDLAGTSRLSADLRFGTLSPRQVWTRISSESGGGEGATAVLRQLLWREFAYSTLWDRPHLLEEPFRSDFRGFPWRDDRADFEAWAEGRTGYPVVDAAARELLATGFVHNRARMIAASFLSKHLLLDFRLGEAHYLRLLADGDPALNDMGWQWSSGCGCDAQPYFRVFNPVTQGKKFDPDGSYVRRWIPELEGLPTRFIHSPWEAPAAILSEAGVRLPEDYPHPIVEHRYARGRFLGTADRHFSAARERPHSTRKPS